MKNLIFIHGAGNEGSVWSNLIGYLNGNYKIFTPDLPGHGKQKGTIDNIDNYAVWVLNYIKKTGLSDVVLIGHSMGGAICIKAATDKCISGLVVVDSGLKLPVSPKIINGLKENMTTTVETIAQWSFSKSADGELKKKAVDMMLKNKNALLNDFNACKTYEGYKEAGTIDIPCFVIVGRYDVMTPLELAAETAEHLKTKVEIVENAGHMVQLENPSELAKKIDDFLSSAF